MEPGQEFKQLMESEDGQYMADHALSTIIDLLNNNEDDCAKEVIMAWVFFGINSLEDDAVNNGPDS